MLTHWSGTQFNICLHSIESYGAAAVIHSPPPFAMLKWAWGLGTRCSEINFFPSFAAREEGSGSQSVSHNSVVVVVVVAVLVGW